MVHICAFVRSFKNDIINLIVEECIKLFREMRRKDKSGSQELAVKLLTNTNEGYLSTISVDNGYPAIICVNHYYDGEYIYFHSAKSGHKIDNINDNEKVCFMVTDGIESNQKLMRLNIEA